MEEPENVTANYKLILDSNDAIEFSIVLGLMESNNFDFITYTPGAGDGMIAEHPIEPWQIYIHKNEFDEAFKLIQESKNSLQETTEDKEWRKQILVKWKRGINIGRIILLFIIALFGSISYSAYERSLIVGNLLLLFTLFFVVVFIFTFNRKNISSD